MSMEFDLLNEDGDVLDVEQNPLCVVLNSTGTRLGVGGTSGFRVFAMRQTSLDTTGVYFEELIRYPPPGATIEDDDDMSFGFGESPADAKTKDRPSLPAGVGAMALLGETSTLAVVGGGPTAMAPMHTVQIFLGTSLTQSIELQDAVRRLAITPWFIVALTINAIEVVSLKGDKLMSLPAVGNPLSMPPGPLALHTSRRLIAIPWCDGSQPTDQRSAPTRYGLRVIGYPSEALLTTTLPTERDFSMVTSVVEAHKTPLTSICLNFDGTLVATSSERGTLVRVWTTLSGTVIKELRSASIASPLSQLCFIGNLYFAGQSGSRVKVFFVGEEDRVVDTKTQEIEWWEGHKEFAALAKNQVSSLATLGYVCQYFSSKWAAAECELPIANFMPVCLTIRDHHREGSNHRASSGQLVGSGSILREAVTTTSSWLGYIGSWVGTAPTATKPNNAPGGAPEPVTSMASLAPSQPTRSDYTPQP